MNFPERLVIDLKKWPRRSNRLVSILQNISNSSFCLEYIDVGNDIKYCINEVPNFYLKLSELMKNVYSQRGRDLLGNRFNKFSSYKYVELIFSNDFKTIISIRFLGKVKRRGRDKIIRYVQFNIDNIFDPNIVYLIYRANEIISKFAPTTFENITGIEVDLGAFLGGIGFEDTTKNSFTKFLDSYLVPAPSLHKKEIRPLECLLGDLKSQIDGLRPAANLNLSLSWQDPKPLNEIANSFLQNKKSIEASFYGNQLPGQGFELGMEWKEYKNLEMVRKEKSIYNNAQNSTQIYNLRKVNYDPSSPLNQILIDGQGLNRKLNNIDDPAVCITTLSGEFFGKIDICYLIKNFLSTCSADLMEQFLKTTTLTEFFNKIDNWKNPAIEAFYRKIWSDKFLWGALRKIEVLLKDYICIDAITETYRFEKVSVVLKKLSAQFPQHADTINSIFEENFSRDLLIDMLKQLTNIQGLVDVCSWRWPNISLPKFTFKSIYDDFIIDIQSLILNLICGLLSQLSKALLNAVTNLCSLPTFFVDIFMNFQNMFLNPLLVSTGYEPLGEQKTAQEKWEEYVRYCYEMISRANNLNMNFTSITDPELLKILNSVTPQTAPIQLIDAVFTDVDSCGNLYLPPNLEDEQSPIPGTPGNEYNLGPIISNINNYSYCIGRDNFYTNHISEEVSIQSLKAISEILKIQQERQEQINYIASMDQGELSQRLFRMIEQIQSVLSPRDLSMLIMGTYTDNVAEIVRMICKINFPSLSDKLDPIKYFIMMGKVLGGMPIVNAARG